MAVLTTNERTQIHRGLMRYFSSIFDEVSINKAALLTFIEETDSWINDNQSSYLTSLSEPAKSSLSNAQLTLGFAAIAILRHGDVALLKSMLGQEVD